MTQYSWQQYYQASLFRPDVMEAIESILAGMSDGHATSPEDLSHDIVGSPFSYDQIASVIKGLESVGVLRPFGPRLYQLDRQAFDDSAVLRRRVLKAIAWTREHTLPDQCDPLLAVPADARAQIAMPYERSFFDLRTAVRSLIASASRRLVLASPFWDTDVARDIGALIERRLAAGVEVFILARWPASTTPSREALELLGRMNAGSENFHLLILDRQSDQDPFGTSTFHFKTVCADAQRVYLGSANFNTAGLASRWELGVLLEGRHAQLIAALLDSLLSVAQPLETL